MKQTNVVRQIKDIQEWTDAFSRYAAIFCEAHPRKCVEMWRYQDVIRQAQRKWGGFGWRAYDEQFRALMAVYPRSWSIVDQSIWSLCVTCPQQPAAPMPSQSTQNNQNGAPKKQKGGNNPNMGGGPHANSSNKNGANQSKGGKNQQAGANRGPNSNMCRDFQMGVCRRFKCRFPHICAWCNGPHQGDQCPNKQ